MNIKITASLINTITVAVLVDSLMPLTKSIVIIITSKIAGILIAKGMKPNSLGISTLGSSPISV